MKFQLTSLVTLAFLYGSVTATLAPVPADDPVLAQISARIIPDLNLGPSRVTFNGYCTRRDVEEEDQSIADSIFNTAGNVIGGLWHNIVPSSGYYASLHGAGACAPVNGGGFYCPQRRDVEEEDQSILDSVFNTFGHLVGGAWNDILPSSVVLASAKDAGACLVRNNQLICPSS